MPIKKATGRSIQRRIRAVQVDIGEITVETTSGLFRIDAIIAGEWAAHPRCGGGEWRFEGEWNGLAISHAPSGFALAALVDDLALHDAVRIIRALAADIPIGVINDSTPKEWEWIASAIIGEALMGEVKR